MNQHVRTLISSLPGDRTPLAPLTADTAAGELRGPGGVERIDPKVMQVFETLLAADGEVVSRESLLQAAWPDAAVTDDVVTRCIYALRGHLAGAGGSNDYRNLLETLPKRGYRLYLEQREPGPEAAPDAATRRLPALAVMLLAIGALAGAWWLFSGQPPGGLDDPVSVAPPTGELAIAVLPFVNMSADAEQQFFADGLSEELINLLANTLDIRVIARTSSFSFRDRSADIAEIARQLDVTHVLEGSVRRAGDRMRITAQLIDAKTSGHLWSNTYDRAASDTFAVQDEIAAAVARALHLRITPVQQAASASTPNPLAHDAYLRGRYLFHRRTPGDLVRAQQYFEEAVRIDPGYALAWASLAGSLYVQEYRDDIDDSALMERRREAVEQALSLGPGLAEAHARAAQYYEDAGDKNAARRYMAQAVALDPGNQLVLGFLAGRAAWRGDFEQAIDLQRKAQQRDPLSSINTGNLVTFLLAAGRADEAEVELARLNEIQGNNALPGMEAQHLDVLLLKGRLVEALARVRSWPADNARTQYLAMILPALGRQDEANEAFARLAAIPGFEGAIRRAEVLAFRKEVDACINELEPLRNWLRKEESPQKDYRWGSQARLSPYLNSALANDPRWLEMWQDSPMQW